jgi:hypothetical protein
MQPLYLSLKKPNEQQDQVKEVKLEGSIGASGLAFDLLKLVFKQAAGSNMKAVASVGN